MGCPAQVGAERILKRCSSTPSNQGCPARWRGANSAACSSSTPSNQGGQHAVRLQEAPRFVLAPLQTRGVQHWMCLSDCHLWEIGELQVKKSPRAFLNGSMHTSVFLVSQYGA